MKNNRDDLIKMSSRIPRIVFVALVLVSVLFVGISSAELNLTVEVPSSPASVGETISLPVILNNDIDFAGFMSTVSNDIEGVTVELQEDEPITLLTDTSVYSYGGNGKSLLKVLEFNTDPVTDAKIHLFTVNVTINDANVKNVPLKITLEELISKSNGDIPLDSVVMVNLSGVQLTPETSLSVTSEPGNLLQPAETVTPTFASTTRPTSVASIDVSGSGSSAGQTSASTSSSGQTGSSGDSSSSDKAKTPGFGIIGVLAGLGIAGVVLHQRRNK